MVGFASSYSSQISTLFAARSQDDGSTRRLGDADLVEGEARRARSSAQAEQEARAEDGLSVREGMAVDDVRLSVERYRKRAAEMQVAIDKMRADAPDQQDFETSIAAQILGIESTGDDFSDAILAAIRGAEQPMILS